MAGLVELQLAQAAEAGQRVQVAVAQPAGVAQVQHLELGERLQQGELLGLGVDQAHGRGARPAELGDDLRGQPHQRETAPGRPRRHVEGHAAPFAPTGQPGLDAATVGVPHRRQHVDVRGEELDLLGRGGGDDEQREQQAQARVDQRAPSRKRSASRDPSSVSRSASGGPAVSRGA